jgi:hypothetical protein
MPNTPKQIVPYPAEVAIDQTTVFDLYVSGDFEIRLFGDPVIVEGQHIPIQRLIFNSTFWLRVVRCLFYWSNNSMYTRLRRRVDILGTQAFGIGLKSVSDWWCTDTVVSSTNQVCLVQVPQTLTDPLLGLGGFPFQFRPIRHRTPSISNSSAYLYAERSDSFLKIASISLWFSDKSTLKLE